MLLMLYDMDGFSVFYVLYVLAMLRELCVGCAKYTGCVVVSYVLTVLYLLHVLCMLLDMYVNNVL